MEDINTVVAKNLRRIRDSRSVSLEELARLSGVSRSMLVRIEKGDGNPSLSTLWKVANGLGVPFDELIERRGPDFEIVRTSEVQPIPEDGGRVRNYSIFPLSRCSPGRWRCVQEGARSYYLALTACVSRRTRSTAMPTRETRCVLCT